MNKLLRKFQRLLVILVFCLSCAYSFNSLDLCYAQDSASFQELASKFRRLARLEEKAGINYIPYDFWSQGEYTDLLKGKKRTEGDVLPKTECLHEDAKCADEH